MFTPTVTFNKIINTSTPIQLIKYATQAAICVASVLFIIKASVWLNTGSQTIKLSLLDSGFDIFISFTNYLIVILVPQTSNNKFFCYHKIAAISTIIQSILMLITVAYSLLTALSLEVPHASLYSVSMLFISLALSYILVSFQRRVIEATDSLIVHADMMHYQTDLFMSSASIICLIGARYYPIPWLDSSIALGIGLYLLKTIGYLFYKAFRVLLDPNQHKDTIFSCHHS